MHTLQNIIDYAGSQGYHLQFSGDVDPQKHPSLSQVKAWDRLLQEYEWVWHTDQDMLVMNFNQSLESFLDDRFDVILGRDCFTYEMALKSGLLGLDAVRLALNTGSFFMKSSAWTLESLSKAWDVNGTNIRQALSVSWFDDAAAMLVFENDFKAGGHIKLVSSRDFNAWPENRRSVIGSVTSTTCDFDRGVFYEPGDFAMRFVAGSSSGEEKWDKADSIWYVGEDE